MNSKHAILSSLILSAMLGCASTSASDRATEPAVALIHAKDEDRWYTNLVDFDYVRSQAEIPPKEGVTIIDSRPAARKYDLGHIPGAINIPDSQFDKLTEKLPADKKTLLIFYCEGPKCILSHNSAFKAERLGYTNVKVYPNGFPEWKAKGMHVAVSAAYVRRQLQETTNAVLIDVRPARAFAKGSILGAINMPETKFEKQAGKLPADKSTPLIFFCGGLRCVLSHKAADKAKALGYTSTMTYPEGYPEWEKLHGACASAPVEAAPEEPAAAKPTAGLEPGKHKGTISASSFIEVMRKSPHSILVVDVRDAREFKKAAIKGAINIPIAQLEKKLDTLPKDKPIVFVCGAGSRSGEAYDSVKLLRRDLEPWFIDAEISFSANGAFSITAK